MKLTGNQNHNYKHWNERMDYACERVVSSPISVIYAPAGYGKTTFVKKAIERSGLFAIWTSASLGSIEQIWQSMLLAFEQAFPNLKQWWPETNVVNNDSIRQLCIFFNKINDEVETAVVIDDFQLFEQGRILFSPFIKELSQYIHLIFVTRKNICSNAEQLFSTSGINFITKNVLVFEKDDIKEYFAKNGIQLSHPEIEAAYHYSEGWPAFLHLLVQECYHSGCFRLSCEAEQLLVKDISKTDRQFTVILSLFDSFDYKLIYWFVKKGIFKFNKNIFFQHTYIFIDDGNGFYHIQSALRNLFLQLFSLFKNEDRNNIYRVAAEYFCITQSYADAIRFYRLCTETEKIIEIFESMDESGEYIKYITEVFPALEEYDESLWQRHPHILLYYIITCNIMKLTNKEQYALKLFEKFSTDKAFRQQKYYCSLMRDYEIIMANNKVLDIDLRYSHMQKAREYHFLADTKRTSYISKMNWCAAGLSPISGIFYGSVELDSVLPKYLESINMYYDINHQYGFGFDDLLLAELHFMRGNFEDSLSKTCCALDKAQSNQSTGLELLSKFYLIRSALCAGDIEISHQCWESFIREYKTTQNKPNRDCCELIIAFCEYVLNIQTSVFNTAIEEEFTIRQKCEQACVYPATRLIMLFRKGKYQYITHWEESLNNLFVNDGYIYKIYYYIIVAVCYHKIGRYKEAMHRMKLALDVSIRNKIVMPFAEFGKECYPLLIQCAPEEFCNLVAEKMKQLTKNISIVRDFMAKRQNSGLTPREYEIAKHACLGLTYEEIAKKLYISKNTVKTILQSCYKKLEINSRSELREFFRDRQLYV